MLQAAQSQQIDSRVTHLAHQMTPEQKQAFMDGLARAQQSVTDAKKGAVAADLKVAKLRTMYGFAKATAKEGEKMGEKKAQKKIAKKVAKKAEKKAAKKAEKKVAKKAEKKVAKKFSSPAAQNAAKVEDAEDAAKVTATEQAKQKETVAPATSKSAKSTTAAIIKAAQTKAPAPAATAPATPPPVTDAKSTAAAIIKAAQTKANLEAKEATEAKEAKEAKETVELEIPSADSKAAKQAEVERLLASADSAMNDKGGKESEVKHMLESADSTFEGKNAAADAVKHLLAAADSALNGKAPQVSPAVKTTAPVKEQQATALPQRTVPSKQPKQQKVHAQLQAKSTTPSATPPAQVVASLHSVNHDSAVMVDPLLKDSNSSEKESPTPEQAAMNADLMRWQKMLIKPPPEAQLYDPDLMTPIEEMGDDGLAEMATMSAGVGASTGLYVLLSDLWRSDIPNHAGGALPLTKNLSCDGCLIVLNHGCRLHGLFPACASNVQVRRVMKGCAAKGLKTRSANAKPGSAAAFTCPRITGPDQANSNAAVQELVEKWKELPKTQQSHVKSLAELEANY
jgi:hypothetical protein